LANSLRIALGASLCQCILLLGGQTGILADLMQILADVLFSGSYLKIGYRCGNI
jgi:hypothetical protein